MSITSVVARVNKNLGEGTLLLGSDMIGHEIPRITTGSLSLDLALGGGFPMNCWCSIEGEPSNGKSVIALKTIAANQVINRDFHCLWIASEPFVVPWAITCGVDMNRMIVASTQVMEDAFQIAIEMIDDRLVDAVVIDSLSSLTPTEEDEKAMDQVQVALGARITGKFMRKSSSAQRRSLTTPDRACLGIIISQWREKVGYTYGDNRVTPYGRAKEFFYMVRMEVRRDEWLGTDKHRTGLGFKVRISKNKTSPPQRSAAMDFYWEDTPNHRAGSYDLGKQVGNIALDLDIIEQRSSVYKYAGRSWRGKEALFAAIENEPALVSALDGEVRHRLLGRTDTDNVRPMPAKKRTLKRVAS
jgi:recombination protein RecA